MISLGIMKNTLILGICIIQEHRIFVNQAVSRFNNPWEMESPRSQKTTTVWMGDAATKDLTGSTGISLGV